MKVRHSKKVTPLQPKLLRKYVDRAKDNVMILGGSVIEASISFGWDSVHGSLPQDIADMYQRQIAAVMHKLNLQFSLLLVVFHDDEVIESEVICIENLNKFEMDDLATQHLEHMFEEADPDTRISCGYLVVPNSSDISDSVISEFVNVFEFKGAFDRDITKSRMANKKDHTYTPGLSYLAIGDLNEFKDRIDKLHETILR